MTSLKRRWIFILIIGIALLTLPPEIVNHFEQTGNLQQAQKQTPHKTVQLTNGITHYEISGPANQNCIILIHGVSGPMSVWKKLTPILNEAKHRVLAYDLFGRGLSDRPSTPNTPKLFRTQLLQLTRHTGCIGKNTLIGSSMGAIIASDFALQYPKKTRNIILIGPAGFQLSATPASKLMHIPYLGEYAMAIIGRNSLIGHNKKYYQNPEHLPEVLPEFTAQFRYKGFKQAILSTMRHMPVQNFTNGYRKLGASHINKTIIWGKHDKTFPITFLDQAKAWIKPDSTHILKRSAHYPQYEEADKVGKIILKLLRQQ